MLFTKNLLQTY
ncbi:hypothetical protein YPPY34_3884, partial [Yersinia pestis PY-34]